MANPMTPEHKIMIYQSLLKETEDAAVTLLTRLIASFPGRLESLAVEFAQESGDGIDPLSKIMRRTALELQHMIAERG